MIRAVQRDFVFGDNRPFASCHASTHVHMGNGEVLVAWFGGTKEGAPDVAIWISRRGQGGQWTAPEIAADEPRIPHWNPVLFRAGDGRIVLYYKTGHKIATWSTKLIESLDEASTWSVPRELVSGDRGGRGPVKNKPILLNSGRILAPASSEGDDWNGFVDYSDDDGRSWHQSETVPLNRYKEAPGEAPLERSDIPVTPQSFTGKGVIQPTLWEMESGAVGMLLRSTTGWIMRSASVDGGATWSTGKPTELPNNNSGIDLAKSESGTIALAYNPVGENWGPRTPLQVVLSHDDGTTWTDKLVLEDAPGEYSYPAVVSSGSGFSATYTWKRERIAYVEF